MTTNFGQRAAGVQQLLYLMMEQLELCFPDLNMSCWKTQRPQCYTVLIYIVVSFISLVTVTLNLLVIVSISHFKQLHTPTNLLLLSLAASDFLVGLVMLFQIMVIDGCWYLGDIMCTLYYVLDTISTSTSIGNMVLISIDRYVAICNPLHYCSRVTPQRVQVCVSLCWICSLIVFLFQIRKKLKEPESYNSCVGECALLLNLNEEIADLLLTFIVPITVIIVLYMRVFVVAVSQARAMRSHVMVATLQYSVKVRAEKSELKAARTLGVVIVVFLFCICPYYSATTGQDTLVSASSAAGLLMLLYSNSCLNPIVYALFYSWFRKSVRLIVTLEILKSGSRDINML